MCDLPVGVQRVIEAMHGMARHAVTATSVGLVPLDREQRLALLSSIDSTAVLVALGEMQAELDAAMLSSAETLPIEAMRIVDSQWYEPVRQQLVAGHRLAPPQTMVRLMREIIEAGEGPRVGIEDDDARLQLLLSVNEDHDTPSGRAARFNAMDMRQMDVEMRGMSEDELIEFANEMAVDQAASMMFNASRLPEQMKCMTHEFWYQPWAEKVGDQLGATPSDTFREATGISMDEFLEAGDVIVSVLRTGRARFDIGALHRHGVSDEVVQYIKRNMVREPRRIPRHVAAGSRARRRPIAAVYVHAVPVPRPQRRRSARTSSAMGHGRVLRERPRVRCSAGLHRAGKAGPGNAVPGCGQAPVRADRRSENCPHRCEQCVFGSIVDEEEMQTAWTVKSGGRPKACDWMLPTDSRFAWLIDATHRPGHWSHRRADKEGLRRGFHRWSPGLGHLKESELVEVLQPVDLLVVGQDAVQARAELAFGDFAGGRAGQPAM